MTTSAEVQKVNAEDVAQALKDIGEKLTGSESEMVLDFSSIWRIDTAGLRAFEDLAAVADGKTVKIALRGVNVDVYKVLKLARLTTRFSFLN
jgi:anti-anti-sigma regulatory factor